MLFLCFIRVYSITKFVCPCVVAMHIVYVRKLDIQFHVSSRCYCFCAFATNVLCATAAATYIHTHTHHTYISIRNYHRCTVILRSPRRIYPFGIFSSIFRLVILETAVFSFTTYFRLSKILPPSQFFKIIFPRYYTTSYRRVAAAPM